MQSYYLILKLIFHGFINNIVFSRTQMIDKIIYDIGIFKSMFIFFMGHLIFSGSKQDSWLENCIKHLIKNNSRDEYYK